MTPDSLVARLGNYRDLVSRVDEMCRRIEESLRPEITCTRGCDGCCRHLSLFPVEAMALAEELRKLPPPEVDRIRVRARASLPDGPCPLLEQHCCLLYPARPLICRTHGLPLLVNRGEERRVDHCPLNFRGLSCLPGSAVIDLDRLNETLVAVNLLFTAPQGLSSPFPERFTIAEALLLETSLS
jgi:Fe-S-cluster containining protein